MDARLTPVGDRYELILERSLDHPPETVWRVLTERDLLKQWFPCDIEGDWQVGAPLRFHFLRGEDAGLPEDQLRGEVLVVDPPHRLEFRWGDGVIRCLLTPEDSGCRLRFSEQIPGPSWGARNAAGWELCLQNLDLLINGLEIAAFAMEVWRKRFEHYVGQFEPQHGTQDEPPELVTQALEQAEDENAKSGD